METPVRPLKIKLHCPAQQEKEQDPFMAKINSRTLEEEGQEEERVEILLRRKKTRDEGHKGEKSSPVKDNIPKPRHEEPQPRKESEPVLEAPMRQETLKLDVQEPVIELSVSPTPQQQQELELPLTTQNRLPVSEDATPRPDPARQQSTGSNGYGG